MIRTLIFSTLLSLTQYLHAQDSLQWVNQFGGAYTGSGSAYHEEIMGMVVDDSGNVYVNGMVYGPLTIEANTYPHPIGNGTGFVVKFDSNGSFLWHTNTRFPQPHSLFRDPLSNSCLMATPNEIVRVYTNGDTSHFFSNNHGCIWEMNVAPSGKVYTLALGNAGWMYNNQHALNPDTTYLAIHDTNGNVLQFKPIFYSITGGIPFVSNVTSVQVNTLGEIFIGGLAQFSSFHILGGDTIDAGNVGFTGFVIKLDSTGSFEWCLQSSDGGTSLTHFSITHDENFILSLSHISSLPNDMFGNYPMNKRIAISDEYWFMMIGRDGIPKFLEETEYISTGIGDARGQRVFDCSSLPRQPLSVAQFNDSMFIPASSPVNNTAAFFEYDTTANGLAQCQYLHVEIPVNSSLNARPSQIAIDPHGNLYMAGITPASIHFKDSVYPYRGGDYDMFIAKWTYKKETTEALDSCFAPSNFVVDNVTDTTARLSWNSSPTAITYGLEYGPSGFSHGSGTSLNQTDTVVLIESLTPETAYQAYLFAVCADSAHSDTLGPIDFLTEASETTNDSTDTTSIANINSEVKLRIYPVPGDETFTIEYTLLNNIQARVEFYTTTGMLVHKEKRITQSGQLKVNTKDWPSGVYLVHLKTDTGLMQVRKITVMH